MIDAVHIYRNYEDGQQEEVSDPLEMLACIMDVCHDSVMSMSFIGFASWLGTTVYEWAIHHHFSVEQTEQILDEIKSIAMQVYKERPEDFPETTEEVPYD